MKRKITLYRFVEDRKPGQTMADRAASVAPALANECMSAPTRELAQRLSGTVEVLLLWHPQIDQVELSVHDFVTGASFQIEVEPGTAIDAFYHPYAYAAYRVDRDETTIADG
jgi:hypothetical protein